MTFRGASLVVLLAALGLPSCSDDAVGGSETASASGSTENTTQPGTATVGSNTTPTTSTAPTTGSTHTPTTGTSTSTETGNGTSSSTGFKFDLPVPDEGDIDPGTSGEVDESTCEGAAMSLTTAGCLFAPIVTKETGSLPWAVIAANSGDTEATATLYDTNDNVLGSETIQPGELHVFEFSSQQLANLGIPVPSNGSSLGKRALRLESDRPIAAYQFLPYSSSQVATADAALLLPEHAWGDNYLAIMAANDGVGWVSVVSLEDGNEVDIYISQDAQGVTGGGDGIPGLGAGDSHTEILDRQDVMRIGGSSDTISGAGIYSTGPVAIYVGSPGMSLPGPGFQGWKDSHEEQIPPRAAWGTDYAVVKFRPRKTEADLYRIIADKDGTVIDLTGDYQGQLNLDEGQFAEVFTDKSFYASANEAFMVAHFLVSASENSGMKDDDMYPGWFVASNNCGNGPQSQNSAGDLGDPATSFIPPIDQYRSRYTFLTPYTYAWDMVTVVSSAGGWDTIMLDDQPLPEPTPLNGGDQVYAQFLVEDGPHYIESPSHKFGIEVYGYDCRISYAYPGGLSLGSINIPPPPPG